MPRPSQAEQQRKKLLPIVCRVFSELGYRRTTTAVLARQCEVRENILYRLWPDKKAMFLAAIDDVFERRAETWGKLLAGGPAGGQATERLLAYEAKHQGEFGFYRVVFTALAETDDADIRAALVRMYGRFHRIMRQRVGADRQGDCPDFRAQTRSVGTKMGLSPSRDRQGRPQGPGLPCDSAAWALIGLATVSNIVRELELLKPRQRERMFAAVARRLIQ